MLRERNGTPRGVCDSAAIRSRVVPKLKSMREKRRKVRQLRGNGGSRSHTFGVIARLDRAIQYAEAAVVEPRRRSVLDAPVKPGHDSAKRGFGVRRHG